MNKKITVSGVLLILVVGLIISCSANTQEVSMSETSRDKMTVLTSCLSDLGKKYDVYFTIEEAYEERGIQNPISSSLIPCSIGNSALNEALLSLREALPDVEIRRSETNLAVIHLIDSRLQAMEDYALDYILDSFIYSGPITQVVDEVAKRVPGLVRRTVFVVGMGHMVMDMTTEINVSATNCSVRDIFTNYIPLSIYKRVLWIANTKLGDKPKTTMQFLGQATPSK